MEHTCPCVGLFISRQPLKISDMNILMEQEYQYFVKLQPDGVTVAL